MSLPELLHHRERFVGCLTLRRFRKPPDDGDAVDSFWSRLFHPMGTSGYWLLLATHAYDDGTRRCPVLGSDGRCGIQHDNKPAHCSAVPLDPLASIAEQARHLELDRRFWANAVYSLLPLDLLESSLIPSDGFLSISIVPVLMVIARVSDGCRERCLGYLKAQELAIEAALARLPAHAAHAQGQLSGFAENAITLRQLLANSPSPRSASSAQEARDVERWLDTGAFQDAGAEARATAYNARDEYFALDLANMQRDACVAVLRTR